MGINLVFMIPAIYIIYQGHLLEGKSYLSKLPFILGSYCIFLSIVGWVGMVPGLRQTVRKRLKNVYQFGMGMLLIISCIVLSVVFTKYKRLCKKTH